MVEARAHLPNNILYFTFCSSLPTCNLTHITVLETAMKRKVNHETAARKRSKNADEQDKSAISFQEGDSVQELARAYRLVTARLPVSALDPTWSVGQNRRLDERHAGQLCMIFEQGGLNRKAKENHLRVLCSAADVERMLNSLDGDTTSDTDIIPYFHHWNEVNNGRKVELMAGQHRVRALGRYLEKTGCKEEEAWWTCEFYDKGRMSAASPGPNRC